jgi:hypothetical protein
VIGKKIISMIIFGNKGKMLLIVLMMDSKIVRRSRLVRGTKLKVYLSMHSGCGRKIMGKGD